MEIVKQLPRPYNSLMYALQCFLTESHMPDGVDVKGLYHQTIENFLSATELQIPGRYLWLYQEDGIVKIYVLSHISKDIDNRLCYWVTQAWVDKELRGTKKVKECWEKLKSHAKDLLCAHIVIPSTRNPKAYCRFLGGRMSEYATIIQQEI